MRDLDGDSFIIGTMTQSFSRINSFATGCHYEWYKHYVECADSKPGFFGQYGGFGHKVIEKYCKGELPVFELSQYYEDHFCDEVTCDAPPNKYKDIKADYYEKGLEYFDNIDLPIDEYEVVGVEKEIHFEFGGYKFIGFIDLLLRDPADGKLILCDHKSSTIKKLKNGGISRADQEHFLSFRRQQYLYADAVIEEYGADSIKALWWNMFKDQDWIKIPFNVNEYKEAHDWALDVIHMIENETEWEPKVNDFYCRYLCSLPECEHRP